MQINEHNYIMVSGWMRTRLGLKGNELLLFAMIYGFCQDRDNAYKCSIKYIQDWLGCSKQTAVNTIKSLEEKELVVKNKTTKANDGYDANEYAVNFVKIEEYREGNLKIRQGGSLKIRQGVVQKLDYPSLKIRPNNNIYNNNISTSQLMRARTCVSEAETEREDNDFFIELSKNQQMMEAACMNLKITPKIFKERLQEFETECKAKATKHEDLNDYRRHFYDWLRIQVKNDISRESQAARGRSPYDYVPDYKIL